MGGNLSRVMDAPAGTRYAYSLYWAIAIVETIGYGDILPSQPSTVFALLLVMLVGVFVFSYLMGNVTSIVNLFDGLEARSSAAREEVSPSNNFAPARVHVCMQRMRHTLSSSRCSASTSNRRFPIISPRDLKSGSCSSAPPATPPSYDVLLLHAYFHLDTLPL